MEKSYKNGNPMDIPENNEEKSLAIKEWSENNKHLENAITSCIDNNIPTFASCAGHKLLDLPYLSLKVNKNNLGKILNIMNALSCNNGTELALSYMAEQGSILTITTDMLHKNSVFDEVSKAAKGKMNFQDTIPVVQELYNMHRSLRTHFQEHEIEIKKSRSFRTMTIIPYTQLLDRYILDKLDLKRIEQQSKLEYRKRFFRTDKLREVATTMITMVDDTFKENAEDDLFEQEDEEKRNDLKSRIKVNIKPVNVDEIKPNNPKAEKVIEE